jgi:chaperonin GroES
VTLKPINDNIVVKPKPFEEKTIGGLIIPQAALKAMNNPKLVEAEVISVGKGRYTSNGALIPCDVKPGDKIYFGGMGYTGTVYIEDGIEYRIIKMIDVLMKIED